MVVQPNTVKGAVGVLSGGRGVGVPAVGTRRAEGIRGTLEFLLLFLQEGIGTSSARPG